MFRSTPANPQKLKRFADELDAIVLRPYYPASNLFRVTDEDGALQVDFMATIHGVRSFESLRRRSSEVIMGTRARVRHRRAGIRQLQERGA